MGASGAIFSSDWGKPESQGARSLHECAEHQGSNEENEVVPDDHLAVGEADAFPRRVQLSPNRVGWRDDSVDEWIKNRPSPKPSSVSKVNELVTHLPNTNNASGTVTSKRK
jgi:hypothetical protein